MNGIHDLGGMHGFGPIAIDPDEPVFRAEWEPHVRVLTSLSTRGGLFTLDAFRFGIERMEPAVYLATPYHERWLASVEWNLIENGWIGQDELDKRIEHLRKNPDESPHIAGSVVTPDAGSEVAPVPPPRFSLGDTVVTRNIHPKGHTRLPRYARGKRGVINLVHRPEPLPDTHAHGLGANPEVVYNVRFDATELWGSAAEPRQTVCIDLWDSYLDPA